MVESLRPPVTMGVLDTSDVVRGPSGSASWRIGIGVSLFGLRPIIQAFLWVARIISLGLRTIGIFAAGMPPKGHLEVSYGHRIPTLVEPSVGGIVKFQRMQAVFPNSLWRFNILYLVSSRLPHTPIGLVRVARSKGARFVWNQNGVAYPGWYGPGWERINAPLKTLLYEADYVFYQSEFCRRTADQFLGKRTGPHEILYNSVDTTTFAPPTTRLSRQPLTLLVAGTQDLYYRLSVPLQTLAVIARERPDVQMLVAGRLRWIPDEQECRRVAARLVSELGLEDRVRFLGPYAQAEAPQLFKKAHVLIHAKYNDPCPTVILEAMACGLPVVYSASGGVPELVGSEAGIGLQADLSWEQQLPPDPKAVARAVLEIAEGRDRFAEAARQRAVDRFDVRPWLHRHRAIFEELVH